jgi:hypothetical protein
VPEESARAEPAAAPAGRYGPAVTPVQRRRRILVTAAVAAVLGIATVVWAGSAVVGVPVRTQDVGFRVVDDGAVDVTFIVVREPGAVVRCRVRALSPSFAEVGARDVTVAATPHRSVEVTTRVATSERATTGLVQRCRPVGDP